MAIRRGRRAQPAVLASATFDPPATCADTFYRGMTDLVLLELDPEQLDAPVVIESLFPHLYVEIDPRAVDLVRAYRPRPDGTFDPIA